ncbi:MAG: hypothetical protein Kow0090_18440 [Myxococcota bacterium]
MTVSPVNLGKLLSKKLILVSGKGGVGKTTVTAALGVILAREGKNVLLAEINSSGRIPAIFGKKTEGDELIKLSENLWTVNVNPNDSLKEYAIMTLKFKALYNLVFENKIVKYFLKAVPALAEITMLGKLWYISTLDVSYQGAGPFDVIFIDAPATGHFKSFILTAESLVKLTPPGPMRTNAKNIDRWLRNPREGGFVLVTIPQEMPVNEAIELAQFVKRVGRVEPIFAVANMISPFFTQREKFEELEKKISGGNAFDNPTGRLKEMLNLFSERLRLLAKQNEELKRLKETIQWEVALLPRLNSAHLSQKEILLFADLLTQKESLAFNSSIYLGGETDALETNGRKEKQT